jgi:molybdopterin-binding protein
MNVLHGRIVEINTEKDISLVRVRVDDHVFSSIVIDTPATSSYLAIDHPVRVLFKETEVVIARGATGGLAISMQNKIECRITGIHTGNILCELTLAWHRPAGHQPAETEIRSVITRNACDQLHLQVGDSVLALVKTNEVSLSPHD